eukprot:338347_1
MSVGFGWNWENKNGDEDDEDEDEDDGDYEIDEQEVTDSIMNCPLSFIIHNSLRPKLLSDEAKNILYKCCKVFVEEQRKCSGRLAKAHQKANECLKNYGFCSKINNGKLPISVFGGSGIYQFDWNYSPPSIDKIVKFVMFASQLDWEQVMDGIGPWFNLLLPTETLEAQCLADSNKLSDKAIAAGIKALNSVRKSNTPPINKQVFVIAETMSKIIQQGRYIRNKMKNCKIAPFETDSKSKISKYTKFLRYFLFNFDVIFDFGFVKPSLRTICGTVAEFTDAPKNKKRRLQDFFMSYPVLPDLNLPCIPIAPPMLMLCPLIYVETKFGIEFEPQVEIPDIGIGLQPFTSFDITASLALRIGVPILYAQIEMGVQVSLIAVSFPFEMGINIEDFGMYGDIGVDVKVLQLSIFLQFKMCAGAWIFQYCFTQELWSMSFSAWEYNVQLAEWGTGSKAEKTQIEGEQKVSVDQGVTTIRYYWAFKDSEDSHNGKYDYKWAESDFDNFTVDKWTHEILEITACPLKAASITKQWHVLTNLKNTSEEFYINNPYYCEENLLGFDKLLVTEITIQWYEKVGMNSCFESRVKPMFKEKLCCNFAFKIYDKISEVTGKEFELSSYKLIVMDLLENWSDNCAEFYLNSEVQINKRIYYDDCSDLGWKVAQELDTKYDLGFHNIYGEDTLVHYNGKSTCLNVFNSTQIKKTTRTFNIFYRYDFLMVGLRFWAKPSVNHDSSHWYGIKLQNKLNYYWINNVDINCDPTEDGYNKWYHVNMNIAGISDSTNYCYSDVLIYFDPLIEAEEKYSFTLEMIANIPEDEIWGFSSLVMSTFDDDKICINGVNQIIELTTEYSDVVYEYYGLKNIPSIYYGYVLFEISFDYTFHDISALISLSPNNLNDEITNHWVIHF